MHRALLVAAVIAIAATSGVAQEAATLQRLPNAALLRDWALARCLAKAEGAAPAGREDAVASAGALLEASRLPAEAFARIDRTVDAELARRGNASSDGRRLHLLACLDVLRSTELSRAFARETRPRRR